MKTSKSQSAHMLPLRSEKVPEFFLGSRAARDLPNDGESDAHFGPNQQRTMWWSFTSNAKRSFANERI